ncbi:MAG: protein kinase [Deltaproteobacteria bacterium]|nr:protein kinase [Deltaproteobacteria bacterium]
MIKALTHDAYPGATSSAHQRSVNRRQMAQVIQAMHDLGLRPSKASRRVGEYELGELVREGDGYQEHLASHASMPARKRRVRSYLVPQATAPERRGQLERAARREAQILETLGEHPSILSCSDYIDVPQPGPSLLFESFEEALPLDMFIRLRPDLTFDDRMTILQRVSEAIAFCHDKGVLHRNISPSAVLVRKRDSEAVEVRIHGFHLATHSEGTRGTLHLTAMSEQMDLVYRAPEVLDDPQRASVFSDMFSLGALACFVLSGRHPAPTLAEREALLNEQDSLRLSTLSDGFSLLFDECIGYATHRHAADRPDAPMDWYALLEDAATSPTVEETPPDLDPWQATANTELADGFVVQRLLGSGTTAKVFHVTQAGKHYALKVPHDDGCAERLRAEAEVLDRLRHQHIVQSHGMRRVGSRDCLLLNLAAPQKWRLRDDTTEPRTLAELIRQQGPVHLDYAKRFGDDLLSALQYLEEQGVQHRDIKPGNIGFTPSQKQARHLVLFDFSLSAVDASQIMVGTPGYRDPALRLRGRWDAAADRFSAAATLYEMLVGTRLDLSPSLNHGDSLNHGERDGPLIQGERFDATVRDRLMAFFRRALHTDSSKRFASAEKMRHEWLAALAALAVPQSSEEQHVTSATAGALPTEAATKTETIATSAGETSPSRRRAPSQARERVSDLPEASTQDPFSKVTLTTPVEALALMTPSAKSALDRAGIVNVSDLLQLPRNHLSAIRGIGQQVARDIQLVAERLRQRKGEQHTTSALVPGFRGMREALQPGALGLSRADCASLRDAGIFSTTDLAATASERVTRLIGQTRAEKLQKLLKDQKVSDAPQNLAEWVSLLLPKAAKKPTQAERSMRALVGLEPLGSPDRLKAGDCLSVAQVASRLKASRVTVVKALKEARERWADTAHLEGLITACESVVRAYGGICGLARAAADLVRHDGLHGQATRHGDIQAHPTHDPAKDRAQALGDDELRLASAVLRVVAELRDEGGEVESLYLRKIRGICFLATDAELVDVARQLGGVADRLAAEQPLPSVDRVQKNLAESLAHSPLASLSPERSVHLAAAASEHACASSRLELYPRDMSAKRALDLSAAILSSGELTPDAVQKRVRSRYPEAADLPPRPELDALLDHHSLTFDATVGVYRRPDMQPATTAMSGTRLFATLISTAQSDAPLLDTPAANEARVFHEALRAAVERGRFRVLQVRSDLADQAALRVAQEIKVEPTSLDALLATCLEAERVENEVDEENVMSADREGPKGPHWSLLTQLIGQAADKMVADLLGDRTKPRVLTAPGSFARYGLVAQLQRLIDRSEVEDGEAVLMLVPSYDTGRAPTINNTLAVPAPLPGQRLKVPKSWLTNAHRAARTEQSEQSV